MSKNIKWHASKVVTTLRHQRLGQNGVTLWLTGLSGSGKSTLAFCLEHELVNRGHHAYVLDGDNLRHGLNSDLGFSLHDRSENIRRVGEVAKLFNESGVITMVSFISPYHADRRKVRSAHDASKLPFIEVYLATPIEVCEQRDPKGLYKLARAGKIESFTGVNDPYEEPVSPEICISDPKITPEECSEQIINELVSRNLLNNTATLNQTRSHNG